MIRSASILFLLLAPGCMQRTVATCSESDCDVGCCLDGVCVDGTRDNVCGNGGAACVDCTRSARVCALAHCEAPHSDGGALADLATGDLATSDLSSLPDLGPPPPKWVFVTNESWNGDFVTAAMGGNGLASGDKLCAASAVLGNLGGSWKAWLSDGTTNAIDRVGGSGPWYLVGGGQVFADRASLAGAPTLPINHTQYGKAPAGDNLVWTATSNGTFNSLDCYEWTSGKNGDFGNVGNANGTNDWSANNGVYCDGAHHIYCFQQ